MFSWVGFTLIWALMPFCRHGGLLADGCAVRARYEVMSGCCLCGLIGWESGDTEAYDGWRA